MSYAFQPMTEEELNAANLVDDGVYNFEVIKATKKTSSKGNPMAELNIRFWDNEGVVHTMFDYLVFSQVPLNIKKVKHFCDSTGLSEEYKRGELPEELVGLSGKFELKTQEEQPNGKGGFYPPKNVVSDYVMTGKGAVKAPTADEFDTNSDLPF
jgi:hypothetical protein